METNLVPSVYCFWIQCVSKMAQKNLETWRRHHSRTFLCCLRPQTKNISYHYHFYYHHQNLCTAVNLWSFSELITARRREARQWQWQRQGLNNLHSFPSPGLNIANHDQTLPFSISNIANPWPNIANLRPNIANLRPKLPVLGSWLPLLHTHLSMQKIEILKRSDSKFQCADGHIFYTFKFAIWCQKFDWSWYRAFIARQNLDLPKMYLCWRRGPVWVGGHKKL